MLARRERRGFAMVAVLLVLMALFVLCAPFLLTVRNADKSSAQLADRASARIALDAAERHARAQLAASHPALDPTPYYDSLDELDVTNRFEKDFLNPSDPSGPMWGLDVEDVAGQIDLNSASPHVLANLLGGVARLTKPIMDANEKELSVNTTAGFLPQGFVWVGGELIGYGQLDTAGLGRLSRGVGVKLDEDGNALPCAPQPAGAHALGEFVIDQRMWAIPRWRLVSGRDGRLGRFNALEDVGEAAIFSMVEELGPDVLAKLESATSVHGGVRAGPEWQHGARITGTAQGKPDYGCTLPLTDARYFNAGTTVMVTDGKTTEFGIVKSSGPGGIQLMDPLAYEYPPYTAVVYPLARRPVDVNTASIEVLHALMENLKLKGRSARLTSTEVEALIEVIVESRPFTGLEDFMRRVVLPAAGLDELPEDAPVVPEKLAELAQLTETGSDGIKKYYGFIDQDDAVALYKNALDANDSELEFSTMPFSFTSRDVYRLALRSSINAPSGVERSKRVREVVELIVPQQDLLSVWARQEDFDDAPRFDNEAPGWMTGPEATHRFDPVFASPWPTRARANLGPWDTSPSVDPLAAAGERVYTFASREDDGWAQLAPARTDETGTRQNRVLHFDDETRQLEGRYLPDGSVTLDPSKSVVSWSGSGPGALLQPLSCDLWLKPRDLIDGERYLDLGGAYPDTDRVSLMLDGGDLVLRVLDAAGDHPQSSFDEKAEVRYPLAGDGPGLPLDVWTNVEIRVAGNRPDQMTMLVDGRASANTPGLTRLSSAITSDATTIPVESTDGFPDPCVIRIGDELIEVTVNGKQAFEATYAGVGEHAGFGGRLARELFQGAEPAELNMALAAKDTDHPQGAAVELYGYSLPVFTNVPAGFGTLSSGLGAFAVGRVNGIVESGKEQLGNQMEPIIIGGTSGISLGWGMDGKGNEVTGLVLEPADPSRSVEDVMQAFSQTGGYAALLSLSYTFNVGVPFNESNIDYDVDGTRLGGIEVVYYSGWSGNQLDIVRRGDKVPELDNLANAPKELLGRGSFVFEWDLASFVDQSRNDHLILRTMVIPISLPVKGAGGISSFLPARAGDSNFAQVTHSGGESELTEWVRYDEIVADQLVRDDPAALVLANNAAHAGITTVVPGDVQPPNPSNPGQPGGGLNPGNNLIAPDPGPVRVTKPAPAQSPQGGSYWYYGIGQAEDANFPVSRAVASQFQFRGVMGTHSHAHAGGALVLPVWKAVDLDETSGRPGRLDHVMLFDEDPSLPGFPGIVQHAHRPFQYTVYAYQEGSAPLSAQSSGAGVETLQTGFITNVVHVALQQPLNIPIAASAKPGDGRDTRLQSRMTLFPSGERPRQVNAFVLGGSFQGGATPSAVVDEVVFGNDLLDGQLVVRTAFGMGSKDLDVLQDTLRTSAGDFQVPGVLATLPQEAGLLRIGEEIVCYDGYDAQGGVIHVPPEGRGLLGTDEENHVVGEGITYLASWRVAVLAGNIGPDDGEIPVLGAQDFPSEGTLLIDDELVHYTYRLGGALAMPRRSSRPGAMDRKGGGLFRGRYGTEPAGHTGGTPVIVFPFRYWDRWSERADAPELHYLELSVDQPDAFWERVFWDEESSPMAGPRLGVLQRTRPNRPWDADPEEDDALQLLWEGKLDQEGNPIGMQSDRAAWRVFVQYQPGSFDPRLGLAHGWKTTPLLRLFGVEYMGPNRTLRRVDR